MSQIKWVLIFFAGLLYVTAYADSMQFIEGSALQNEQKPDYNEKKSTNRGHLRSFQSDVREESLPSDIQIVKDRVVAELMKPAIDKSKVDSLMSSIQEDGTWSGINYKDTSNTGFDHKRHLENMIELSRAYKKQESGFYGDLKVKQTVHRALDFWVEHDFISENWWWNQIGTPERLVNTLLIMDQDLTEYQKKKAAPIVSRANLDAWGARPGGDLIKIAGIYTKYGLFTENYDIVEEGTRVMASEIQFAVDRETPSDLRGLQTDLSFHHRHDEVTSTLSYGLQFARVFADWATKLTGTTFRLPDQRIELLVDYYLDGIIQTTVYGKYPDPGAKNRSITRRGTLHAYSPETPENLLQATDYRSNELEQIVKIRKNQIEPDLTSSKFFWRSEYLSHERPDYFTSVRMFSSRNHSMEVPYNGEGLKNHHLGDGSNFISRTGKEYINIFPAWDWQKIPGTTVLQKPSLPAMDEIQQKGLTDFVGAASDGRYGAAAFDFKSPLDPLEARKAWFLFDEEYVCLGAGIRSSSDYHVATTLNQSLLRHEVVVNKADRNATLKRGTHNLTDVNWILHDRIAYLFPVSTDVHIKNKKANGSWYSINHQSDSPKEKISKDIFTVWLDHGNKPQNESYKYIVVPEIDTSKIESYQKEIPIEILSNTPEIQAVKHTGLGINQIVFYQAGEIQIMESIKLTIDTPGIVMVQTDAEKIKKITVADPTRKLESIHLKVTSPFKTNGDNVKVTWNKEKGYSDMDIDLPQEGYAGKSVVIESASF